MDENNINNNVNFQSIMIDFNIVRSSDSYFDN